MRGRGARGCLEDRFVRKENPVLSETPWRFVALVVKTPRPSARLRAED
jgi:hypothetical protein